MKKLGLLTLIAMMMIAIGCDKKETTETTDGGDATPKQKVYQIAVIPKGTTHVFWKSIHAGAEKAAQELGVKAIWQGPEREDDRVMQIDVVQNFISRQVDAIVLAPLDETALVTPVKEAVDQDIKVVIIDSGLRTDVYDSFVATDNKEGGRMGARRLAEVLDGKGKVVMMRYMVGSASTQNREDGFMEEIAKYPDIEVISDNIYSGATKEEALTNSENLLNKFGEQADGIFCPNESSAFGMLRALQNAGLAGKIKYVGFDASEPLIDGLRKGQIHGLVAQDPFDMGYQGVKTAVAAIKGETVEKRIATRLALVTKENLEDKEIAETINPPIDQYVQ